MAELCECLPKRSFMCVRETPISTVLFVSVNMQEMESGRESSSPPIPFVHSLGPGLALSSLKAAFTCAAVDPPLGLPLAPVGNRILLLALMNQLLTCDSVKPVMLHNDRFSSSVGYGWLACSSNHDLSRSVTGLGSLPRRRGGGAMPADGPGGTWVLGTGMGRPTIAPPGRGIPP